MSIETSTSTRYILSFSTSLVNLTLSVVPSSPLLPDWAYMSKDQVFIVSELFWKSCLSFRYHLLILPKRHNLSVSKSRTVKKKVSTSNLGCAYDTDLLLYMLITSLYILSTGSYQEIWHCKPVTRLSNFSSTPEDYVVTEERIFVGFLLQKFLFEFMVPSDRDSGTWDVFLHRLVTRPQRPYPKVRLRLRR